MLENVLREFTARLNSVVIRERLLRIMLRMISKCLIATALACVLQSTTLSDLILTIGAAEVMSNNMSNAASLGCDTDTLLSNAETYSESSDSDVEEIERANPIRLDALDLAFDATQEQFIAPFFADRADWINVFSPEEILRIAITAMLGNLDLNADSDGEPMEEDDGGDAVEEDNGDEEDVNMEED
ncbi:hypothetical protein CRE_09066 [Caenorhabditis remanei]|uniref:Uncharacterized protein n=1 Tax=Caenorhabditis remanei TaxID=31234 RepID=E3LJ55_CAERE|nr:hypothetical protein CRE_09066 [Caenorhabditis remanei]